MKCLILGAGIGKRLQPLSNEIPAPMLPILNKPLILYILEHIKNFGINEIKISLYHLPEVIDAYLGEGEELDLKISYSLEKDLLGTGYAVKRIPSFFDDTILIHYGNVLSNIDINEFYLFHKQRKSIFTYAVLENRIAKETPEILLDQKSQVINYKYRENESHYPFIPAGIFLAEKEILDFIPSNKKYSLEEELLNEIIEKKLPVFAFIHKGDYYKIQYPKDLLEINLQLLKFLSVAEGKLVFGFKDGVNKEVLNSISSPIFIGENSVINKNVSIKSPVVIGDDVIVDEGATLSNSLILNNTYIGKNIEIENSIVFKNLCINTRNDYGFYVTDSFILAPVVKVKLADKIKEILFRVIDIILSSLGLILLSPILLLIALAIKIDSKGPVFFKSKRVQKPQLIQQSDKWYLYEPEKSVYYYKFRTMRVDNFSKDEFRKENIYNEGPYFKLKSDPRVTRVGKFLRKTSLDELPLLFNVLKGDLSLVGVWGLPPDEAQSLLETGVTKELYQLKDTAQIRFRGKLGLAGYWQSRGRSELTAEERAIHDAIQALADIKDAKLKSRLGDYSKANSLRGYISLILDTIKSVIKRKGAY
ncbi:MAG: sugar transferase [Ignavibacteria bacterium]|jgi:NDP-sugar pyrophosphorylase family protein|nr:sugar transferase [Ignavibacteria bacterium]MDH7526910.1 sugar transferase [Ignavibacteria bacterium]